MAVGESPESLQESLRGEVAAHFQVDSLCAKTHEETYTCLHDCGPTRISLHGDEWSGEIQTGNGEGCFWPCPSHHLVLRHLIGILVWCTATADDLQESPETEDEMVIHMMA